MRHLTISLLLVATLLILVIGFFAIFVQLSGIDGRLVKVLSSPAEEALEVISEGELPETPTPDEAEGAITIPTAIILQTESSPALQPQTKLAVIVESVSKDEEGIITVRARAFTSEASGYTALQAGEMFEIVDLSSGANQRPFEVAESFASMPPKSATNGTVRFRVSPSQRSVILQIKATNSTLFYRFHFDRKTYEETVLG